MPTTEQEKSLRVQCPTCGALPGEYCEQQTRKRSRPNQVGGSESGVRPDRQPSHRARYQLGMRRQA
jgi:hypothetical protein